MPSAEIITIGTEILLGEIVDTNAQYLARKFRDAGIDLFHKSTVGDNADRIAQVIRHAMESSDIIITTGGLGPTVDDPTREAIAMAVGVELEYRPELWEQITARFQRYDREPTENNKRQAFVPKGAVPVENPVGTAPAFIVEHTISSSPQGSALPSGSKSSHGSTEAPSRTIIALPGVPREMEYLLEKEVLPYLRTRYQLSGIIKTRLIHTVGVGESQIDDLIGDLETLSNPTVGLAAHSGQVDVRITAKAGSEAQANELIRGIETTLVERLNTWIYGADQETLEDVALKALKRREWTLATTTSSCSSTASGQSSAPSSRMSASVPLSRRMRTLSCTWSISSHWRRSRSSERPPA